MPTRLLRDYTDSPAFDGISAEAERLFIRLLLKADDFGRFHAHARLVKAACFPLAEDLRANTVAAWLTELSDRHLVFCYTSGTGEYLQIPKFGAPRAKSSKYPPPPDICEHLQTDANKSKQMRPYSYSYSVFGIREEKEPACAGEGGEIAPDIAETIEAIRLAYVRHDAPDDVRQAIRQALDSECIPATMLDAVKACADFCRQAPGGPFNKFVPTARKFFVESQWLHPEAFRDRWKPRKEASEKGNTYTVPDKF